MTIMPTVTRRFSAPAGGLAVAAPEMVSDGGGAFWGGAIFCGVTWLGAGAAGGTPCASAGANGNNRNAPTTKGILRKSKAAARHASATPPKGILLPGRMGEKLARKTSRAN